MPAKIIEIGIDLFKKIY